MTIDTGVVQRWVGALTRRHGCPAVEARRIVHNVLMDTPHRATDDELAVAFLRADKQAEALTVEVTSAVAATRMVAARQVIRVA